MNRPATQLTVATLEVAFDDLIVNQRGIDFQRIAIPLARIRHPQLVANEVTKDGGEDGFIAAAALGESQVLAVGCSLTATWQKIQGDIRKAKARKRGLTAFWFYTPRKVTTARTDPWTSNAREEFGVALTVFSREELIQQLLDPRNHYLARHHLGMAISVMAGADEMRAKLHQSSVERVERWFGHYMALNLRPVQREYWVGEDRATQRKIGLEEVVNEILNGGLFMLRGEGGLGKTIALGQISNAIVHRDNASVPLLVSAPSWARSRDTLAVFLAAQFLGRDDQSVAAIQQLMTQGEIVVLLNGWNEIGAEHLERLSEELVNIKLSAPGCAIVLTSRVNAAHGLGPLVTYELTPLSRAGRRAFVEQLSQGEGDWIVDTIEGLTELDALSRLPLFLAPLTTAVARRDVIPRSQYELLESAIVAIEQAPDHAEVLGRPSIRDLYRVALARIAVELTRRNTTEASRREAEGWILGLVGTKQESRELTEILIQHHVVVLEGGETVRFQHQYFQDWFCAQQLWYVCRNAARDETLAELIDNRRFDLAWKLLLGSLANKPVTDEIVAVVSRLFDIALEVDTRLAAEWVPVIGMRIEAVRINALKARLHAWVEKGGPAKKLALLAVIDARFDDFADEYWRRLESDNQQVRLKMYRFGGSMPVEVLGHDWRARVSRWPAERRAEFATEAIVAGSQDNLVLAKDYATRDPSAIVRGKCLAHIAFYDRTSAVRLFAGANREVVATMLEKGVLDDMPAELVSPYLPYIEQLARALPLNYLGSRALSYLSEANPTLAVEIEKRELLAGAIDRQHVPRILERIAKRDKPWAANWVRQQLAGGNYVSDELHPLLCEVEAAEIERTFEEIVGNRDFPGRRLAQALEPILKLGNRNVVARCLELVTQLEERVVNERGRVDERVRDRMHEMHQALSHVPVSALVEVVVANGDRYLGDQSVASTVRALTASIRSDPDSVPDSGSAAGIVLQELVRRIGTIVFAIEDLSGNEKVNLAQLIKLVRYGALQDLLWNLVAAESRRVREHFAAARRPGARVGGGYMSHERWYVSAVSESSGAEWVASLLRLFEDEVFEIEAGHELVRKLGIPLIGGGDSILPRLEWAKIAAAHASVGAIQTSREAQEVATIVEQHLNAWATRLDQPVALGSRESRMATLAVMLARLTGRVQVEPLLGLEANIYSIYTIERWMHILLRCGITVPSVVTNRALDAWLASAEKRWQRPDESAHVIKQLLIALLFSEDLAFAAARIRDLLPQLSPRWQLRDLVVPVAVSTARDRVSLLLEMLPDEDDDSYWSSWTGAVGHLPLGEQQQVVRKLLTEDAWTAGMKRARTESRDTLSVFVPIVQGDAEARRQMNVAALSSGGNIRTRLARALLISVGDSQSAVAVLEAALARPELRDFARSVIQSSRWHPRSGYHRIPDFQAPRALTDLRRMLLHAAYEADPDTGNWACDVLLELDAALDEAYPVDELRHPHFVSGLGWPKLQEGAAIN